MECPKCLSENREGAKFCGECGHKFEIICPACGTNNRAGNKFCDECGSKLSLPLQRVPKDLSFDEKLAKIQKYLPQGLTEKILSQRDRIEGERKQVTVMFCDMEGFTPLSELLGRKNELERSLAMQAIKDLKMEHNAVHLTLRILDKICQRIEKAEEIIDLQHIDQLLEFFKVFVDKCHHGKEEELLFPALENAGVSNKGGLIEVLLHEHQQGREYVQAMNVALAQFKKGDRKVVNEFVKTAREYINLLDQHIDKENNGCWKDWKIYICNE